MWGATREALALDERVRRAVEAPGGIPAELLARVALAVLAGIPAVGRASGAGRDSGRACGAGRSEFIREFGAGRASGRDTVLRVSEDGVRER